MRFFNDYGPWRRPDAALSRFKAAILANQPIDIYHQGCHRRDLTYVDDVVEGIVRVFKVPAPPDPAKRSDSPDPASSSAPSRPYNIGNSQPIELLHLIELLEKALERRVVRNYLPRQPGDTEHTFADITALVRDVGFAPDTPIEVGIAQFVDWSREYCEV